MAFKIKRIHAMTLRNLKRNEPLHHKAKVLTKEEVESNRSGAYKYLDL